MVIDAFLEDALKRYIADHRLNAAPNELLWVTQDGTESTREGMRGLMRTLGKLAGARNAQWHRCRHFYATALVRGGVDLFSVKAQLGHANLATLLRYTHLTADQRPAMPAIIDVMGGGLATLSQADQSILSKLVPLASAHRKPRIRMKLA